MNSVFSTIAVSILISGAAIAAGAGPPSETALTYQGILQHNGAPTEGTFDLTFSLWDAESGGNQIDSTIAFNAMAIADGLVNVELDFGAAAFDNTARWLQITVDATTLSPRRRITRSPYSIQTRGIFVGENDNVGIGTTSPDYPLHVETSAVRAIYGETASGAFNAAGVFGAATATTAPGLVYGGRFESAGMQGRGVFGLATHATGATSGVYGSNVSTAGSGVFGLAGAASGETYGVHGQSNSASGIGVRGSAMTTSGLNYGVYGSTPSNSGCGVYGEASATIGFNSGVMGQSDSAGGTGVRGQATATVGLNYGVVGESNSSTGGRGVLGIATASTGINYGVRGESNSTNGRGVFGEATTTSGLNFGVRGRSNSASGFDFYADGAGTDYGSSSSRRWKSDIRNIDEPLAKIARLRGVYYNWDKEHGGRHDVGMIAEEVGEVLPEIVNYEENGIDAIGMDYGKLTPLLVEAVNALRRENDELKDRLAALEAAVASVAAAEQRGAP